MAKKYFYTDYVPEGYEEIGGKLRKPLKNFLGYITRYTRHDATYTSVGYKPLSLDRFASELKMSKSTAQEFIALLEAKGYVEVERGGTYDKDNNRYNANRFRLANQYAALVGLNNTQDMTPEQQQAPEEKNYKELYNSVYARFRNWIMDLSGMDSGKDGGKFIEAAVAYYRNHKDSNGQPDEEKNALQAENKQLKAEVERLRKCLDASLQEDTPQEQHDIEVQKLRNSNNQLVEDIKRLTKERDDFKNKYYDKLLGDKMNQDVMKYKNEAEQLQEEVNRLRVENAQQKKAHEAKVEELNDTITNLNGAIKILQNDLKKAKTEVPSLVVEPSTPYGNNVKLIQCN